MIRTGAHVSRVLFDGTQTRGVEYTSEGAAQRVRSDSVVLCAGAVRSPQLLMLSGVGPADHLPEFGIVAVQDLPGVGAGLQDHPAAVVSWPVVRGETWSDAVSARNQRLYDEHRRGPLAAVGQAVAYLRVASGTQVPDVGVTPMLIDLLGQTDPGMCCLVTVLAPPAVGDSFGWHRLIWRTHH